jgi:hypothetical protein
LSIQVNAPASRTVETFATGRVSLLVPRNGRAFHIQREKMKTIGAGEIKGEKPAPFGGRAGKTRGAEEKTSPGQTAYSIPLYIPQHPPAPFASIDPDSKGRNRWFIGILLYTSHKPVSGPRDGARRVPDYFSADASPRD